MVRVLIVGFWYLAVVVGTAGAQQTDAANESDVSAAVDGGPSAVGAQDDAPAQQAQDPVVEDSGAPKTLAGMSILGNEEAPKSLVIVPWKSSEIGDGLGVTDAIDERARPVDKEVFLREISYYELRTGRSDDS